MLPRVSNHDRKANPVIHRQTFMGGKATPLEVHARYAWHGKLCQGCGSASPVIRVRVHVKPEDLEPALEAEIRLRNAVTGGSYIPLYKTIWGNFVTVSDIVACRACQPEMERVAARGPSYALVEIDRGPDAIRPTVQSAGVPS